MRCSSLFFLNAGIYLQAGRRHIKVAPTRALNPTQTPHIYLLTCGAEPFLRSYQLCSHSGTSPQHFIEPECSSPCSQEPSTGPYPEPDRAKSHIRFFSLGSLGPRLFMNFRNRLIFYGEEFIAPRLTPKLEDHTLLAVGDCLFNIFSQLPSISGGRSLHPQPEDAPCRGDKGPT
jgi:hypothetical protein